MPFFAMTVNSPMKRGRNLVLKMADNTIVGRFLAFSKT